MLGGFARNLPNDDQHNVLRVFRGARFVFIYHNRFIPAEGRLSECSHAVGFSSCASVTNTPSEKAGDLEVPKLF